MAMGQARNEGEQDRDVQFMRIALRLAERMLGQTAPNPAVGAIIVDEESGEVIARGWTQLGGRPHAETHVIERAGQAAAGKTMYVTLEPCSHHGQTPPCAQAILAAGIARVVCAIEDPDVRVSGRGLGMLKAAGITVDLGVCAEQARWVTAGHILRMQKRRPLVSLKLAVSADGRLARGTGAPTWVTGAQSRAFGHLLRARADAILVGAQTIADDDPDLTCRLPGLEARSPRRFVLDSGLRISARAKVLAASRQPPAVVFAARGATAPSFLKPDQIRRVAAAEPGRLDLAAVLANLGEGGVTRLLVEGGPTLARSLLDAQLVDEVVIFRGATALGDKGQLPLVDRDLSELEDATRWSVAETRSLGHDVVTSYRAADFART